MNADLGKCVAEYKTSASGFVKVGVIMVACLAVAGGLIFGSITSNDSNIGGRVVMFIFGLLFSLPVMLGMYGLTKGRKNAVRMHERGIAIHKAGDDRAILFDDIAAYSDGSFLVVATKNDDAIEFGLDGLANAADLFSRLREEVVVKRLVPALQTKIEAGDAIPFDGGEILEIVPDVGDAAGFVLDTNGVTVASSQRQVPWNAIDRCGTTESVSPVGKMMITTTSVFMKTATDTLQSAIDPLSDREALLVICNERIAKRN